jgi:lipoprotein NlpD
MKQHSVKKNQVTKKILFMATLAVLSACSSTPNRAPVIERSPEVATSTVVTEPAEKIVIRPSYVVKRGDTLVRIAQENGKSYADILAWNNIVNPNDIKVGQMLWLGPLDGTAGAQTAIVGTPNVEIRTLTPINPSTNKTEPRGDKLAYSEENLNQLQNVDIGSQIVVTKAESPTTEVKPVINISWVWPAEGKVTAVFDDKKNKGINIAGKLGQSIFATSDGKVMYSGNAYRGYGNMLIIQHSNNFLSAYAHSKVNLVKEGQYVTKGQKIAEMGNSDSDTVKLHFEIRQTGKPVDPLKYLPAR